MASSEDELYSPITSCPNGPASIGNKDSSSCLEVTDVSAPTPVLSKGQAKRSKSSKKQEKKEEDIQIEVGALKAIWMRGCLARTLSKAKLEDLEKLTIAEIFSPNTFTLPIVLTTKDQQTTKWIVLEGNHRFSMLKQKSLSEQEKKQVLKVRLIFCSESAFNESRSVAKRLKIDRITTDDAVDWSVLPRSILDTMHRHYRQEETRANSTFSDMEKLRYLIGVLRLKYDEDAKERIRKKPKDRRDIMDFLEQCRFVTSSKQRLKDLPAIVFLMLHESQSEFLKSTSFPRDYHAFLLMKASWKDDNEAAQIAQNHRKKRIDNHELKRRLQLVISGKKEQEIPGMQAVDSVDDIPNGSGVVFFFKSPLSAAQIKEREHTVMIVYPITITAQLEVQFDVRFQIQVTNEAMNGFQGGVAVIVGKRVVDDSEVWTTRKTKSLFAGI